MITLNQYFGKWIDLPDITTFRHHNAVQLIETVNVLMNYMQRDGVIFEINPHTASQISGEYYGGFRPQNCAIGASKSAHKEGQAVDIYDPYGKIDAWLLENKDILPQFNLYFEDPSVTEGWSHWSTRAPKSGNRFFKP